MGEREGIFFVIQTALLKWVFQNKEFVLTHKVLVTIFDVHTVHHLIQLLLLKIIFQQMYFDKDIFDISREQVLENFRIDSNAVL